MKILHPDVLNQLQDVTDMTSLLYLDEKLRGLHVKAADISSLRLKGMAIEESLVSKTNFSETHIEKFETKDCVFKDCDLTASSFSNSSWHVVEILGARCSGVQLQNSTLKNVLFKGCKIEFANFRFSKLENIIFEDCMINDIDFYNATLKNVTFTGSSIENITFAGGRLKSVDLSDAHLVSVKNVSGLKGAMISYEQLTFLAPYFTQELGILIKE
jgi:uncharacterized protein YjbI with pentapeptide repeats